MGYILELKTTQATAIKIVTDAVNSLLTDANFDIYPYYINNDSTTSSGGGEGYNNNDDNLNTDNKKKKKQIGGIVLKEVNKTGKILVYMKLDADKFDIYKYNYNKEKITLGIDIGNLLKCLKCMSHFDTMAWYIDEEDINKLIIVLECLEKKEKKNI